MDGSAGAVDDAERIAGEPLSPRLPRPIEFEYDSSMPGQAFLSTLIVLALLGATSFAAGPDLYGGKVYGIFDPLEVEQTAAAITVAGGTFRYTIDRATGQIVSVKALADEFVAPGSGFPNPYVGLMPDDDPGARREGGKERPRYGYEKSVEMRPLLWSGELTAAVRFDAAKGSGIRTELVRADAGSAEVRASGRYGSSPLSWTIQYLFDVDGFTKITVTLATSEPVKLRWHCFNHALVAKDAVRYLTRVSDPDRSPIEIRPLPTTPINAIEPDQPVLESHWNAFFHLANKVTGIEFSKQDFDDRFGGYRDSSVVLESGKSVDTGAVETADGRRVQGADSRGRASIFTQIYMRDGGLEVEEFDIRNATYPLNPGQIRQRVFWVQATPAKRPRNDLNSLRVVWPGPHQIVMTRWRGTQKAWEPPSDEQVRLWAQMGVNLIIGGANYWSGDYARPLEAAKIRHFIDTAHRYGIKVIPYVTFTDFNFAAPGYQEHAAEWMASKSIEYANETTLMCYNAEGWRDFLEKQWDQLLAAFPFDGLYIDHWINIRHCTNSRHGCGGYLGSFATDGYHDFARRARRVVARHTQGKGIMLLNANMLLFSGVVPWFDIRLNGENDDPLKMREETIVTTWNGWGQGVQSLAMWRPNQDSRSMINLMTTFAIPFRLNRAMTPQSLEGWAVPENPVLALTREFWGIWRFFGLNGAEKFSSFDTGDVLQMTHAGSIVNGFARDGRALIVMGVQGGRGTREETLRILSPARLGLKSGVRYRIADLRENRYLGGPRSLEELGAVSVQLRDDRPLILLIEPARSGPRLVWFGGADEAAVDMRGGTMECKLKTVPGSPVDLYFDLAGGNWRPATPGFTAAASGDFTVFQGPAPEDGVVRLSTGRQ